jgi:hypothetical protein
MMRHLSATLTLIGSTEAAGCNRAAIRRPYDLAA